MKIININSARGRARMTNNLSLLRQAAESSDGIRAQQAAVLTDIDMKSYLISSPVSEFYGINRHPIQGHPLEYITDLGPENSPKTVDGLIEHVAGNRITNDMLTSYPEVIHAEVDAVIKSAHNTTVSKRNALFITSSPCPDCCNMILDNLPNLEAIFFLRPYRITEGLFRLARETDIAIHGIRNSTIYLLESEHDFAQWANMEKREG